MVTKYLISTDGYLESLVSNNDGVHSYVESDNDIRKAIASWAEYSNYVINWNSLKIDYPLREIRFLYDLEAIFDGIGYDLLAVWTLIDITKP